MITKLKDGVFSILYILGLIYLFTFIPNFWGYKPLVVVSGSMEPTLKVGSIVYYHEKNDLEKGDILVYKTKNHIISHRVVDKTEFGYITKGDANECNDSNIVENEQILGQGEEWCIPFLGYYADYVYTHKYLLFIVVSVIIIDLLFDYYKKYKKRGEEIR